MNDTDEMAGLTEPELAALDKLTLAINAIGALPVCHRADWPEMFQHFHAIQNMVMARAAARAYPDRFLTEESFE